MELLRDIAESLRAGLRDLTAQPRYLVYAVLVHVGFIAVLVLSLQWSTVLRPAAPEVNVIQATLVDQSELRKAQEQKEAEARRQAEEAERQRREREEAKQAEEAKAREEQHQAEIRQQQEQAAEAKRQADEAKKRADEQRQADARKQQQEEARRREEQKAAEAKKQAEEAKKLEEQKAAEAKRQAEEAKKRADEQRAREAQEAAERAREQSEMDKYVTAIQSKVSRNWNRPDNWTKGLACTVRVSILPGGEVVDAKITRSCGDPLFDRSVESAVLKAHILPVPSASDPLFDRFRDLEFVFKPEL